MNLINKGYALILCRRAPEAPATDNRLSRVPTGRVSRYNLPLAGQSLGYSISAWASASAFFSASIAGVLLTSTSSIAVPIALLITGQ